jgi:XTP/dITP diphosphohydrolase
LQDEIAAKGLPAGAPIKAHFVCALALRWPDGHIETMEGKVFGTLIFPPRGDQGFGYDPIFIADGKTLTFGEMSMDQKHAISHRADAFRKLVTACFTGAKVA